MSKHNLWIDDLREPPNKEDWVWLKSVNTAKEYILGNHENIEVISLDHDAGDYAKFGGDYIKILDWLEEIANTESKPSIPFTFHIHSMNPVGKAKMQVVIEKNGWKYEYQLNEPVENTFEQCRKCAFENYRCMPPMQGKCKSYLEKNTVREKRCDKCTRELNCRANGSIYPIGKCEKYHRDPPDGGFYG